MKLTRTLTLGLLVIAAFGGAMVGHFATGTGSQASTAPSAYSLRKFYLTKSKVTGSGALSACSAGYHMASFWEIMDVTNLQYDTSLGYTSDDSGSGPPTTGADGWIRTGAMSFTKGLNIGMANCSAWTSASDNDNGSVVGLNAGWVSGIATNAVKIAPWWIAELDNGFPPLCSVPHRVWCAQN
jgi:hypothetical protein